MDYVFMFPSQYKVFRTLIEQGFLYPAKAGEQLTERQKPRTYPFDYVKGIHWSITGKCNLQCRHCYMSAPIQKYNDLSLDEIDRFIQQMAEAEIHQVSITGGEPLTRKDFWQIVKMLKAADIHITQLYTNGLLVTEEFLERLKQEQVNCEFVLSYDGVGMHDWLRGIPGTEKRTINAVRRIKEHEYIVCIETSLHSKNIDTLIPTYHLMKELKTDFWKCSYITNTGQWKQQAEAGCLSQEDIYDYYDKLIALNKNDGYFLGMQLDGYYACRRGTGQEHIPYEEKGKEYYSCASCITQPYLLPDGRLIPCPSFTDRIVEETMPYITEYTLSDIFQNKEGAFYKVTHICSEEIIQGNEACHNCEHNDVCRGGCRAMALLSSENLYGRDSTICNYFRMR